MRTPGYYPTEELLIMDLLGALFVCAAIGGLGFVLMTIWFKKFQDLLDSQQEKSLRLFKEALQAHTEELVSKQQNLLEQQSQSLKQLQNISASSGGQNERAELDALKSYLDESRRIAEIQILAQVIPLIGQNSQSKNAVDFLRGFIHDVELNKKLTEFLRHNPGPFIQGQPGSVVEIVDHKSVPDDNQSFQEKAVAKSPREAAAAWIDMPLRTGEVNPASAEAEAKRAAVEAEAKRAAVEAEAKRAADEAEAKRVAEEAEAKRAAEEAEAKRVAEEADARSNEKAKEEELAQQGGLFNLSDDDLGGMFADLLRDDSVDKKTKPDEASSVQEAKKKPADVEMKKLAELQSLAETETKTTEPSESIINSSLEEEEAFSRLFGSVEKQVQKAEDAPAAEGLFKVSDEDMGGMFDDLLSEDSAEKSRKSEAKAAEIDVSPEIETPSLVELEIDASPESSPLEAQPSSSSSAEEEAALARLFGGMDVSAKQEPVKSGLFNVSDDEMGGMFDKLLSEDSAEKNQVTGPASENEKPASKAADPATVSDSKFVEPTKLGGGADNTVKEADDEKIREAREAEARLFGSLFGSNGSKTGPQSTTGPQSNGSLEASRKLQEHEAEEKRLAEEESERKRQAEDAEKKRLVQELANRVKEDSRKLTNSVSQAENRQLAMEAAERKLAALAAMNPSSEQQQRFEQDRDDEARKLLEASESLRPAEQLDEATERLMALEASGSLQSSISNFDSQSTVEQPFSEAFTKDGNRLFAEGKYAEAERHYRTALPTLEEVMGREHLAVVEILHKLGIIAMKRGKYAEAEETFQQALVRRVMALGGNHPDTVSTLNDLGELYLRRANFKEAKRCFTEALDLRRSSFGDEHRSTAETCHDLGLLYMAMGAYSDASIMMERAFAIRKKTFGSNHPDTVLSKNDLAQLCLLLDKIPQGEVFLTQALSYRQDKLGDEHPEYADSLLILAQYLRKEGKYTEAEEALNKVLNIRKKALGERHPETAAAFNALGILHFDQGNYDEAKRFLTQAMYIRKTSLGENHPESAASMHDFGRLCWKLGTLGDDTQFAEGMPLIEKSLAVRKATLGESHPDTLQSFSSSAEMLISLSSAAEAEPVLRATLIQRKELFGLNHLSVAESDHALAVCLIQMGRIAEAKTLLEEELDVRSKVLGEDNPLVSNAKEERDRLLSAGSRN